VTSAWTRRRVLAAALAGAALLARRAAGIEARTEDAARPTPPAGAPGAFVGAPGGDGARPRIGWLVPAAGAPQAAEQGLALAHEEAERAATLLRVDPPELVRVAGDPAQGLAALARAGAVAALAAFGADALPPAGALAVLAVVPARGAPAPGALQVASSEAARAAALAAAAPDAFGGRAAARAVDWHPALVRYGAAQLNERYARRFGTAMDETAWAAWCAHKAAHETLLRAPASHAGAVREALRALAFDAHKGVPLRFGADGALVQPRYAVDAGGALLGELRP